MNSGTTWTQSQLIAAFKPDIQQALDAVKITNYWKPIITAINNNKKSLGLTSDLNPDLTAYVTEKATIALFNEIKNRENNLRSSLSNRSTDLLKKVFDFADKNKNKPPFLMLCNPTQATNISL